MSRRRDREHHPNVAGALAADARAAAERRTLRHRLVRPWGWVGEHRSDLMPFVIGTIVVVLVFLLLSAAGEQTRRTAQVPVEIVSYDFPSMPHPAISAGRFIRYRYTVDGVTYSANAVRSWSIDTVRHAKACVEPDNPRNQLLVRDDQHCPA